MKLAKERERKMIEKTITVAKDGKAAFRNLTAQCVGTGRLDLGLHKEYQEELRAVQGLCHFQHIRGHGLFSDQMGIYQERRDWNGGTTVEYCFTYLDRVIDSYLENGLEPFLELGFMPEKLAAGEQTLFYWKAHTTPPRKMEDWTKLVKITLAHLAKRYGKAKVEGWPCEIWNEPNLRGFWENADKQKYLELYKATVLAVRETLPRMQVGGPAICGGEGSQQWVKDFLSFCRDEKVPVDFVTRHAYMGQTPEHRGKYLYHAMSRPEDLIAEMRETRNVIDSFPEFRGMPMHITEFNTSYNPFCPIHDTVYNAALCAGLLSRLGDVADSYSYWTFGDVFEEQGIPPRPFHGGFGLMANGLIAKPTLWVFSWFSNLSGEAVYRDDGAVIVKRPDGGYEAVLWNLEAEEKRLELRFPLEGPAAALLETVDEDHGNPLKSWHLMGEPADLNAEQLAFLRAAANPGRAVLAPEDENGAKLLTVTLQKNGVSRLRLLPAEPCADTGYDYAYYTE